jgi:hypothetical protein
MQEIVMGVFLGGSEAFEKGIAPFVPYRRG